MSNYIDPAVWFYEDEKDKLPIVYDNIMPSLSNDQNELIRRQRQSNASSGPRFLPVVQNLETSGIKDHSATANFCPDSKKRDLSSQRSSVNSGPSIKGSGMALHRLALLDIGIEPYLPVLTDPFASIFPENSDSVNVGPISVNQEESKPLTDDWIGFYPVDLDQLCLERLYEDEEIDLVAPMDSAESNDSEDSALPPSFDSYVEVPPPPIYRQAIEVMVTVASMGYHTERQLIQCCEDYLLQAPIPKESITQMRLLLPQLCHVLRYLGILVPCDSSTPLSPFIYRYPSIPESTHSYPSFLCRESSTKEEEKEAEVLSTFKTAQHEEWPLRIPGEGISLAREGIVGDAGWMGPKAKTDLYKWIGAKSADWVRKTEELPPSSANTLVEAMNMPAYDSLLSTSDSTISFNDETEVLPECVLELLRDPNISLNKIQRLDPELQDVFFAYVFNRSSYWRPAPAVPTSYTKVLGDATALKEIREEGSVRLTVNREQLKEVMSGSLWKNQIHAEQVHNELEALKKRELELWRQICARYGYDIVDGKIVRITEPSEEQQTETKVESSSQHPEPVKASGKAKERSVKKKRRSRKKKERSPDKQRLQMSRPLDGSNDNLSLSQPTQSTKVVENEPETKHVTIPTMSTVSRKRPHATQEEKCKEDPILHILVEEVDKYLRMQMTNLQEVKEHLEIRLKKKLKEKELEEKKL